MMRAHDHDTTTGTPPSDTGVLLVSRSPRRRSLLDAHGIAHDAVHPGFEDGVLEPGQVSAEQWITSLAYLKAWAGAGRPEARENGGRIVIGADTACLMNGTLIGTPLSAEHARQMLQGWVGKSHDVLTGVALLDLRAYSGSLNDLPASRRHVIVDRARVHFGTIDAAEIERYVASGMWQGKAGGYNLVERVEAGWPIQSEGDETTIMGLPMDALVKRLGVIAPEVVTAARVRRSGTMLA